MLVLGVLLVPCYALDTITEIKIAQLTFRVYHCLVLFETRTLAGVLCCMLFYQLVLLKFMTCQLVWAYECMRAWEWTNKLPLQQFYCTRESLVTQTLSFYYFTWFCYFSFSYLLSFFGNWISFLGLGWIFLILLSTNVDFLGIKNKKFIIVKNIT